MGYIHAVSGMPASTIAPGAVGLIVVDRDRTFLTIRNAYPT